MPTRSLPLWCPACRSHAHFTPGTISCTCGSPYDPGLPPSPGDLAPGDGIWRHRDAVGGLPVEGTLGEGGTALLEAEIAGHEVRIKQEYASPTGSYKDRGAAYCLSLLASLGAGSVVEDSSGNAGAAYAAYAASLGLRCRVFVPEGAPRAKIGAIRRHGADVRVVPGDREAAHVEARRSPSYAGHAWAAPFLVGVGTIADELLDQMGGAAPDEIILPVGQGGLLYAIYLAYRRLLRAGRIRGIPVLTGAQALRVSPFCRAAGAVGGGETPGAAAGATIADAVAIARPVRLRQVVAAVRATGGEWIAIPEEEIESAQRSLARIGHDVEPASALPWAAAARRARSSRGLRRRTVIPLTGTGWKGGSGGENLLEPLSDD